jgi:hypothetical protein
MKSAAVKILIAVSSSFSGLEIGSLYYKSKMEKGVFESNLKFLIREDLVDSNDDFISITPLGYKIVSSELLERSAFQKLSTDDLFYLPELETKNL